MSFLKLSKHEKTTKSRIQRYVEIGGNAFEWDESGLLLGGPTHLEPKKNGLITIETPNIIVKRWAATLELHPFIYEVVGQAPIFPSVLSEGHEAPVAVKLKLTEELHLPWTVKLFITPVGLDA